MISLTPVGLLVLGFLWRKRPPQKINWVYGYRTGMSLKSPAAWQFAHLYYAGICRWAGGVLLALSLILLFCFKQRVEQAALWLSGLQVAGLLLSEIRTELALRREFDKEGRPRQ